VRNRIHGLLVVFLLFAPSTSYSQALPELEFRVKAAYLLNFGRYVTWPTGALQEELFICTVGRDPFGTILDQVALGRRVQERSVVVRHQLSISDAADACHIVYVSPDLPESVQRRAVEAMSTRPILTVGDHPGFLDHGGILKFVYVEDTIRFSVNLNAARDADLEISSRVLALATSVRGEELQSE
jgi:hypothetical protein